VRFIVWDTGIGIAHDHQGRLFQPFAQVDGSPTRQHEGVGVGLALTRRLAEMHGGAVTVDSKGPGSRFTIMLPWRVAETGASPPAENSPGRIPLVLPSGRPMAILLADHSAVVLMAIGDFLRSLSASVATAQTSQETLAQAQAACPDLIVMDIQMPDLDGLETIRRLKASPETARTPIIVITALAMAGDRERCLEAGADGYLSKPVKLEELARAIHRLLGADHSEPRGARGVPQPGEGKAKT